MTVEEARAVARQIGYPVLVRPSYVLGGRAMVIVYDEATLDNYMSAAVQVSRERPVLIDKFLEDAYEVDVDALCDDEQVVIGGIMEHIEEAGIHSGDSSCVLPTYQLSEDLGRSIRDYTVQLGTGLERCRLDEHAVRDSRRHGLCARSESARVAHRAVCQQGDGRAAGKIAARLMVGRKLQGVRSACRAEGDAVLREVAGVSVLEISRRRHDSGTGDEVDRRSDGRG